MTNDYQLLKKCIVDDKKNYISDNKTKKIYDKLSKQIKISYLKQIIVARKYRYYLENRKNIKNKILFLYYARKNNIMALKNNIELFGKFGKNLKIYHNGIVINKYAILGDNVILHGNNCIGSKKKTMMHQ